ncbi:hypothetical protein GCM10012319_59680 [Comamonas sp. KCTC 72670]|nr:hypothetical protein GCM10012319_59680 [Comamonas sp. KCTC 72670]
MRGRPAHAHFVASRRAQRVQVFGLHATRSSAVAQDLTDARHRGRPNRRREQLDEPGVLHHARVRELAHGEKVGLRGQALTQGAQGESGTVHPIGACASGRRRLRRASVEDDLVTEAAQFVVVAAVLGQHLHPRDSGDDLGKRGEEGRGEHQLLVREDVALDAVAELSRGDLWRRPVQPH